MRPMLHMLAYGANALPVIDMILAKPGYSPTQVKGQGQSKKFKIVLKNVKTQKISIIVPGTYFPYTT